METRFESLCNKTSTSGSAGGVPSGITIIVQFWRHSDDTTSGEATAGPQPNSVGTEQSDGGNDEFSTVDTSDWGKKSERRECHQITGIGRLDPNAKKTSPNAHHPVTAVQGGGTIRWDRGDVRVLGDGGRHCRGLHAVGAARGIGGS